MLLLTIGSSLSSFRSMSPCSKNSLATRSATFHCTSHGFVIAATSQAVIIIPRNSSRWSSCFQSYVRSLISLKKPSRFLLKRVGQIHQCTSIIQARKKKHHFSIAQKNKKKLRKSSSKKKKLHNRLTMAFILLHN